MTSAFTDGKTKLSQIEDRTGQLLASLKLGDDKKSQSFKPDGTEVRRGRSAKSRRTARRLQQILDEHLSPKSNEDQLMMSDNIVYDHNKRQQYEVCASVPASSKQDLKAKITSPLPEEIPPNKEDEENILPGPAEKLQIENLYDKYRALCIKEGILLGEFYPKIDPLKNNGNLELPKSPTQNQGRLASRSRFLSRSKSPGGKTPEQIQEKPLTQSTPIDEILPLQTETDDILNVESQPIGSPRVALNTNSNFENTPRSPRGSPNTSKSPRTFANFGLPRNIGVQTRGPRTYNVSVQTEKARLREHETQTDSLTKFITDAEKHEDEWVVCEKQPQDKTLQSALEMNSLFDTNPFPESAPNNDLPDQEELVQKVPDPNDIQFRQTLEKETVNDRFKLPLDDYPVHNITVLVESYDDCNGQPENYNDHLNHDDYDQIANVSLNMQDPSFPWDERRLHDSYIPKDVYKTFEQDYGSDKGSLVSPGGSKDTAAQIEVSKSDPAKSDLDNFDYYAIQFEMDKQQRNVRMDRVRKHHKAMEEEKEKRRLEANKNSHAGDRSSFDNSRRGSNNTNNSSSPMSSTRQIYSGNCYSPTGSASPHNFSPTDERIRQVAERREKLVRQRHNSALEKEAKSIEAHDKLSKRTKIPMKYFAQTVSTPSVKPKKREHHVTYNVNNQGSGIKYPNQFGSTDDVSSRLKRYTDLSDRPDWVDVTHKDWSK
ncbi:uncharacterized protein LOC142354655 isoform X2 [Convolutriloba macropyga]|uniref:uncharacterized protein LOC142354655 isoform X2 n=1 Tax=Convolutriloba macropyga TaxID=536237 RepID=UPI003F520C23